MFDYHVHTSFSADSKMPMDTACQTAIEAGVKEIAFTEHMDYFYPNCDLTFEFDYGEYSGMVDLLRGRYGSRLTIRKAVEIGIHPYTYLQSKKFTDTNEFDFIIGSVHIADNLDLHNGDYFKGKSLKEALETYFITINTYVKEYQDFNVLGHLTLIKRYLHYVNSHWEKVDWSLYYEIIEDTFKALIQTSRGIEVNLSGYRYRIDSPLPNLPFIQLYKEAGGEIITVGTDAHSRHFVGKHLEIGYSLLKKAGFEYITSFEQRKPTFHKLTDSI
ncbi:histidinol-phosphatase HisJ family protein [Peribacillus kribbensis]|uniref:histidinol-phosphatase HisJ family protein n=1 Tax=Peribacillus kribbensis TaxID=356658 RepID=UPI0003FCDB61|nr:histidinol-phosphatase HisJ family protein [Peribacillus kribbensis]